MSKVEGRAPLGGQTKARLKRAPLGTPLLAGRLKGTFGAIRRGCVADARLRTVDLAEISRPEDRAFSPAGTFPSDDERQGDHQGDIADQGCGDGHVMYSQYEA